MIIENNCYVLYNLYGIINVVIKMKVCRKEETVLYKNSATCENLEYPLGDSDINVSVAKIKGKYPVSGYCVNEEVKELLYVMEGTGKLIKKDETIEFKAGDVILVEKGEAYRWEANCTVLIPCTPAWYPEQHKLIEED